MALIVNNQAQAPVQVITPETCHHYATTLANPRNIKPIHHPFALGRAAWLIGMQIAKLGNPDAIANELRQLHITNQLATSDLRWIRSKAIVKCDFFPKAALDEAIHYTILPHNKVPLAALAQLKGGGGGGGGGGEVVPRVPQSVRRDSIIWKRESEEALKLPTVEDRRKNSKQDTPAINSLDGVNIHALLDIETPGMPIRENVVAIGRLLDNSPKEVALESFKTLPLMSQLYVLEVIKDEYVDSFIEEMRESYITLSYLKKSLENNKMTPTEMRFRFIAYLEQNEANPNVHNRYKKLLAALKAAPPHIDVASAMYQEQKKALDVLLNTVKRRFHNDPRDLPKQKIFKAKVFEDYLDVKPHEVPGYNRVKDLAKVLNKLPKDKAFMSFRSLKLFSQLSLFEKVKADRVGECIASLKSTYLKIANMPPKYIEGKHGLNPAQLTNRFYAHVKLGVDDAALSKRYERLLAVITPA
jgi:hypothetical protein